MLRSVEQKWQQVAETKFVEQKWNLLSRSRFRAAAVAVFVTAMVLDIAWCALVMS